MKKNVLVCVALAIAVGASADEVMPMLRITHGPWLQDVTGTEATISWMTDKPSVGWVEIAPDDGSDFYSEERKRSYDATDGVRRVSTLHSVRVKNLSPGSAYRYRVLAQEVLSRSYNNVLYGRYAATNVYNERIPRFQTADGAANELNFVIVNDIHGDNQLLADLMAQCNDVDYSFVIFNGDMMTFFNDERSAMEGFIDTSVQLFAKDKPFYYVRGNHETRGTLASEYHGYFAPFRERLYGKFQYGPAFFVMLDTGEDKPDSDIEYSGLAEYDAYRSEQSDWLGKVLESPGYAGSPFKIIIAHIPPIVERWHGNMEVDGKFMPPLCAAKPTVMFCGHTHSFSYHEADGSRPFPIVVNANDTVVKVKIKGGAMTVSVTDRRGKVLMCKTYKR